MSKRSLLNIVVFSSVLLASSAYADFGTACNNSGPKEHNKHCSSQAQAVPELDASSGLIALGLIAGLVTLVRERRKFS